MQILCDGDACPGVIKEILCRAAVRLKIKLIFVANQYLKTPQEPTISAIVVPGGFDVADDKIVELTMAGDLIITADIPLAARVVEKGGAAINPRGELYTASNIGARLSMRNAMDELRGSGVQTGGPAPFTKQDGQRFAAQLDKFLAAAAKKQPI